MMTRVSMMIVAFGLMTAGVSRAAPAPAPAPAPIADPAPVVEDPEDETDGGFEITEPVSDTDAAPADPKPGDVLYHVDYWGHGLTTIVADIAFFRQLSKVEKDCAAAGGELKNHTMSTTGIFYYWNSGSADCVKK